MLSAEIERFDAGSQPLPRRLGPERLNAAAAAAPSWSVPRSIDAVRVALDAAAAQRRGRSTIGAALIELG